LRRFTHAPTKAPLGTSCLQNVAMRHGELSTQIDLERPFTGIARISTVAHALPPRPGPFAPLSGFSSRGRLVTAMPPLPRPSAAAGT
jgi:hypothetical protein